MSWRTVVISSSAKLDYQLGFMVVRREETVKVHISEIAVLIIESTAVSLTAALLSKLIENKVKVIFCDEKRNPSSELVAHHGCHDSSIKISNQIGWNEHIKNMVWAEIVAEKIRNQAFHLDKIGKVEESMLLTEYVYQIKEADATNREGHAAKVYFNALFGMDFSRTADNSINAALNYGYSIILSVFNRAITAKGYLTQLGIFHKNMFNHFNFASDLMEPFRILVDMKVKEMMPDDFGKDEKKLMLELLQQEVKIAGRNENVLNAINIYSRSVFDALDENDVSLIKFFTI